MCAFLLGRVCFSVVAFSVVTVSRVCFCRVVLSMAIFSVVTVSRVCFCRVVCEWLSFLLCLRHRQWGSLIIHCRHSQWSFLIHVCVSVRAGLFLSGCLFCCCLLNTSDAADDC